MQAGKLRHRVTIQKPVREQDAAGQLRTTGWDTIAARISAEVLPDRAAEYFQAHGVQSSTNALIRIAYRRGIDDAPAGTMIRVVHHVRDGAEPITQYWDVQGIVHFQTNFEELRLMCIKRDDEGWRE